MLYNAIIVLSNKWYFLAIGVFMMNTNVYRVRPAIDYIEEHYASEISLQNLADICNYSYSHFSKVFIKAFSINPNTYISYTRIRKAEDLLKSTAMNISDIATAVGYNDVSYFIRVFRKLKGISPNKYRKS